MADLLPPNSTALERDLAATIAGRLPLDAPVATLWDPHACPVAFLPWLAWAVGVEEWDENWEEATKRDVIAATPRIRRHRGTVWAVREALRAAGYAGADISEGLPTLRHDGASEHTGVDDYSGGSRWALFSITADIGEQRGVGGAERDRMVRLIERAKPVRSILREIAYRATVADVFDTSDDHSIRVDPALVETRPAGRRYDGAIHHDQATRLPRAPQRHDRSAQHDAYLTYDGLQPTHEWLITGERHDNAWDALALSPRFDTADRHTVAARHDGAAAFEGALSYGAIQPPMTDAGALDITRRRRHNNRLAYDGAHRHRGFAPDRIAI